MATVITINGKRIEIEGNASKISVSGDRITVDGKTVGEGLSGIVEVKWEGPLASLTSYASVQCGDVHGDVDAGNGVQCGNVGGDVDAGNGVQCGNVGGDVDAGGSVNAENVTGNIDAGGSVTVRGEAPVRRGSYR